VGSGTQQEFWGIPRNDPQTEREEKREGGGEKEEEGKRKFEGKLANFRLLWVAK
jgi:hypothetical protein